MKIIELDWIMNNREKLEAEDYKQLQVYNLFNQYDSGELHQSGLKMVEALDLVAGLYQKYKRGGVN